MNSLLLAVLFAGSGSNRPESRLQAALPTPQLIRRYLRAMELQNAAGRCVEVEVTIQAALPKLNRRAELHALRRTSPTGTVTYQALDTWGDRMVRSEVIDRYLTAENQTPQINEIAITPAHYRFRFIRTIEQTDRRIQVFQLTPKQRRLGLFKGELWLDGQTGLPVRESGRFVKNPSVFVRRIEFVRDYEIRDGAAIPGRTASTVETRLVGRAELSVEFSNFSYQECQ